MTWGPPVKVNFELATPNSVHGFTMARSTWSRIIYWDGVRCARAVHVQKYFTPVVLLSPLQAKRWPPLIPNLQVTCMLPQPNIGFLVTVPGGAGCARQDRKSLFARGPTVLGNFDPSTPNLVH